MRIAASERRRQALLNLTHHLFHSRDHERLWRLLRDEGIRPQQIEHSGSHRVCQEGLQQGLDLYVERDGQTRDDDPRLCWLALQASRSSDEVASGHAVALEQAKSRPLSDPQRISDALEWVLSLDRDRLFLSLIDLLWIEADRALELPSNARSSQGLGEILDAFEQQVSTSLDWTRLITPELLAWLGSRLLLAFGHLASCRRRVEATYLRRLSRVVADGSDSSHEREEDLQRFVLGLCRCKEAALALELAYGIEEEAGRNRALAGVARFMAEAGDLDGAWSICRNMAYPDREQVQWTVVREAHRGDRFAEVDHWIRSIENPYIRSRLLGDQAFALARGARMTEARDRFAQALASMVDVMGGEADEIEATSSVASWIGAVLRTAWRQGIRDEELWRQVVRSSAKRSDSHTATKTLKAVAEFLAEVGKMEEALEVAGVMNRDRGGWWCETTAKLAEALAEQGRVSRARSLLETADQIAADSTWGEAGSLASVARAQAACGDHAHAESTFGQAIEAATFFKGGSRRPADWRQAETYQIVFARLGSAPPFPAQRRLLAKAITHLCEMDEPEWKARTLPAAFQAALDTSAPSSLLGELVEIAAEASHANVSDPVLEVIELLVSRRRFDLAWQVARRANQEEANGHLMVAQGLAETGEIHAAQQTFREAFRVAREIFESYGHRHDVLRAVAEIARSGFPVLAFSLSRRLPDLALRSRALSFLVLSLLKQDGVDRAQSIFERVLSLPQPSLAANFQALTGIALELARRAEPELAEKFLCHGLGIALKLPQVEQSTDALRQMIRVFDRSSERIAPPIRLLDLVSDAARELKVDNMKDGVLLELVPLYVKTQHLDRAASVAESIDGCFRQAIGLGSVAQGWLEVGEHVKGFSYFEQALEAARSEVPQSRYTQTGVVEKIVEGSPFPGSNELLKQAMRDAGNREWDSEKAESLVSVTQAILKADAVSEVDGVVETARHLIEKTEMRHSIEEIVTGIAAATARWGRVRDALQMTEALDPRQMVHPRTQAAIVKAVAGRGELREALRLLARIEEPFTRAACIDDLGEIVARMPETDSRRAAFRQLIVLAEGIKDVEKQAYAFGRLARSAAHSGDLRALRSAIGEAVVSIQTKADECQPEMRRSAFLESIVQTWTRLGETRRSLAFIDNAQPAEERPGLFCSLAETLLDKSLKDPELPSLLDRIAEGLPTLPTGRHAKSLVENLAVVRSGLSGQDKSLKLFKSEIQLADAEDDDWRRQRSLEKALAILEGLPKPIASRLLPQIAIVASKLESSKAQERFLGDKLAPAVAAFEAGRSVADALVNDSVTDSARRHFLNAWQEVLIRLGADSKTELRCSLSCFPFERTTGPLGVQAFLEHCLRWGDRETFNAIMTLCPGLIDAVH